MPYVITTLAANFPAEADHTVSRQAVATLEEARAEAKAVVGHDGSVAKAEAFHAAYTLPESGGTVGPLPDGTVIEVERVDWDALDNGVRRHASERSILDAFNAREATTP